MTHRKLLVAALAVLVVYVVWNRQAAEIPSVESITPNVSRERCDRMFEWCAPRECTGSTEWETLKACAEAGYGPPGMPSLRALLCDARAQRCAAARCSDLEWQYILACEHAGLLFSNQQNQ